MWESDATEPVSQGRVVGRGDPNTYFGNQLPTPVPTKDWIQHHSARVAVELGQIPAPL